MEKMRDHMVKEKVQNQEDDFLTKAKRKM